MEKFLMRLKEAWWLIALGAGVAFFAVQNYEPRGASASVEARVMRNVEDKFLSADKASAQRYSELKAVIEVNREAASTESKLMRENQERTVQSVRILAERQEKTNDRLMQIVLALRKLTAADREPSFRQAFNSGRDSATQN